MNVTVAPFYESGMPVWDRLGVNTLYHDVKRSAIIKDIDIRYATWYVACFDR